MTFLTIKLSRKTGCIFTLFRSERSKFIFVKGLFIHNYVEHGYSRNIVEAIYVGHRSAEFVNNMTNTNFHEKNSFINFNVNWKVV